MNPLTGEIIKYWSFKNYLNGDSSQTARAHKLLLSGNFLYVTLQDLEGNSFSHNASGKIGIINFPSFYADSKPGGRSSAADLKKLLAEAREKKADGLVLDLSTNGGGS
jgi:carboxyl-terminal processing protease